MSVLVNVCVSTGGACSTSLVRHSSGELLSCYITQSCVNSTYFLRDNGINSNLAIQFILMTTECVCQSKCR